MLRRFIIAKTSPCNACEACTVLTNRGFDVHIIVVDDGSNDGTREAIHKQFPTVEVITGDGNLWYTAGTNRGIQAALIRKPDYILAINNDQVFDAQALKRLIRCAQQNNKSVIGALLLDWIRPEHVMATGVRWNTWYGGWQHPQSLTAWNVSGNAWEVEIIVGNCVLYPTEAIEQVGLMNEKLFPMYGDVEYTPRMRRNGWRLLIETSAYVWCQPNSTPSSLRTLSFRKLINAIFIDQKNAYNMVTQFRAFCQVAPSRWVGLAAFMIRTVRLSLHSIGLGGSWPLWQDNGKFVEEGGSLLDHQDFTQALASFDSLMSLKTDELAVSQGLVPVSKE